MELTMLTGVLVVTTFIAATATIGAFLLYAVSQADSDADDQMFKPAQYQPMAMLTGRPAAHVEAPEKRAAAPVDVAAAA